MKAFRIRGTFLMGRRRQPFAKEVAGASPEEAVERLLSDLGSRHRAKRRDISIEDVVELTSEDVEDPVVAYRLGGA